MSTVAQLMREWRLATGFSTSEAGAFLGLSSRTIENIEQGRNRANDTLTIIALKKLLSDAK